MTTILIAVGNEFRRDDGVARRVLELLGPRPGSTTLRVPQLAPELAEQIAGFERVVFIDADLEPGGVRLERLSAAEARAAQFGHSMQPAEIVALAAALYGFSGAAYLCRVPGVDFSNGSELTPEAQANALLAVDLLRTLECKI